MDLFLFVSIVPGRFSLSEHTCCCSSIDYTYASAIACSRKILLSAVWDIMSAAVVCCFAFMRWHFWACSSKKCLYGLLARVTCWWMRLVVRKGIRIGLDDGRGWCVIYSWFSWLLRKYFPNMFVNCFNILACSSCSCSLTDSDFFSMYPPGSPLPRWFDHPRRWLVCVSRRDKSGRCQCPWCRPSQDRENARGCNSPSPD